MSNDESDPKALEDLTSQDLVEALVFEEYVEDNVDVCVDYPLDSHGNNMISITINGVPHGRDEGTDGLILFTFDPSGDIVNIEVATCKKGKKNWQIASSDRFVKFEKGFVGFRQPKEEK